jgi:DNA-binding NarL/FixJ family response regulator
MTTCGTILVADDDDAFRSFVAGLFEDIGFGTTQAATGEAVLTAASLEQPAAVVLDVNLPVLNGYEVCRQLRDRFGAAVPIVFVSGERTEGFDRTGGLLLGADDYVVKPVDPGELIARVRRLLHRTAANGPRTERHGRVDTLTRREHEVLDLLASGRGQDEIASLLVISPKTVATHIQRILGKLGVRSRAQAVAYALQTSAA